MGWQLGMQADTTNNLYLFNNNNTEVLRVPFGTKTVAFQGNVGIGTTSPNSTALLDIYSTGKGLLPPRMTTAQRNAISSPATGLTIYNTDNTELETYDGVTNGWEAVGAFAQDAAGSPGDVQFNSGGSLAGTNNFFWDSTNNRLGIGTTSPGVTLDVDGGG